MYHKHSKKLMHECWNECETSLSRTTAKKRHCDLSRGFRGTFWEQYVTNVYNIWTKKNIFNPMEMSLFMFKMRLRTKDFDFFFRFFLITKFLETHCIYNFYITKDNDSSSDICFIAVNFCVCYLNHNNFIVKSINRKCGSYWYMQYG